MKTKADDHRILSFMKKNPHKNYTTSSEVKSTLEEVGYNQEMPS